MSLKIRNSVSIGRLLRSYKTLKVENGGGVSVIHLNRPKKKNAFNVEMYLELSDALAKASSDPAIKVALLTAKGDFYSSGNDLSNFSQMVCPVYFPMNSYINTGRCIHWRWPGSPARNVSIL